VLLRSVARSELVSAMSWLLVPALIGPILGPPVGGFIVTYFDWRWIFYINVPIGVAGMVLVTLFIEDVREEAAGRFDFLGLVLSGVSLASLLFAFETGSRDGGGLDTMLLVAVGLASGALYVRHARATSDPILDLSLMRIPTFGLSVVGGSLTRIAQGAVPFLLPLMLQLGFGRTPAESGLITFVSAAGSMLMKATAPKILRRFGFRATLIGNAVTSTACYATCAAFRPWWPTWTICAVLLAGGFFMSLQFTAYNTVVYDEIPRERMSAASSFYATFQQLMLSLGICVAAMSLHVSMVVGDREHPALQDFSAAFLVATAVALLALYWNAKLPADAGTEISGHRSRVRVVGPGK
jgi:MFS family permease